MIDAALGLTLNFRSQPGTYAVLLGSGISRSASIPTGWEVTLDLVSQLAHLKSVDPKLDAVEWYKAEYGRDPDYSEVIAEIAPKPAAQMELLKGYFEPTIQEREDGLKQPTRAHNAIARLVSLGYIKVIVTTNFDRLLETALYNEGISPTVISSPDDIGGAAPLVHSKCTVIKVHGDYLDTRLKNSPEALGKYDKALNNLLDRVFDEYGLVICGWSGQYDSALRNAIKRNRSRRYPLYWAGVRPLDGVAQEIVSHQNGQFIQINGADDFFEYVSEQIQALDAYKRPHPIGVDAALALLKRYLSDDRYRIQLRDFLVEEAVKSAPRIDEAFSLVSGISPNKETTGELYYRLEAAVEILSRTLGVMSFHANSDQVRAGVEAFSRIAADIKSRGGYNIWIQARIHPTLLLSYAIGIGGLLANNFAFLSELLKRPLIQDDKQNAAVFVPTKVHPHNVLDRDTARQLLAGRERKKTPLNDYLFERMTGVFDSLLILPDKRQDTFDDFEYLWCLLKVDADLQMGLRGWPPYGSFIWRKRDASQSWMKQRLDQIAAGAPDTILDSGLFGGQALRVKAAIDAAAPTLARIEAEIGW